MAQKAATLFILDVSPSMRARKDADGLTYQEHAQKIIYKMLHSKVIVKRKTDTVALLLVGSTETSNILAEDDQYQHIQAYQFSNDEDILFKAADLNLMKYIDAGIEDGSGGGDMMDALIVGIHMIEVFTTGKTGPLKYDRKIYVLTDAANPMVTEDYETVVANAKSQGITMSLIGYDFDDPELPKSEDKPQIKKDNEAFLRNFAEELSGPFFRSDEAAEALDQLRSKDVNMTALFSGALTLGDPELHPESCLSIQVKAFNKTTELKLPSAKKWSTLAESLPAEERENPTFGTVAMDRTYKLAIGDDGTGDPGSAQDDRPLTKEDLVRAYKYGKTLVPMSTEDEEGMKLKTTKGMSIIGFLRKTQMRRYQFMAGIQVVIPDEKYPSAERQFSPLIQGMNDKNMVALVRYVSRDGLSPKLGYLIPDSKNHAMFAHIPFAEDIRQHVFPTLDYLLEDDVAAARASLSQATMSGTTVGSIGGSVGGSKTHRLNTRLVPAQDALDAMDSFIDAMDLMEAVDEGDGEKREAYRPKDVFNPGWQRIYQCIGYRAIHPDDTSLPPIDPRIMACIDPMPELIDQAKPAAEKLQSCFSLKKVEKKASGKRAWTDRAAALGELVNPDDLLNRTDDAAEPSEKRVKVEVEAPAVTSMAALTGRQVEKVTTADPVSDFNAMVSRTDKDLIVPAVTEMCAVITELVTQSFGSQLYDKAFSCLTTLRQASIVYEEPLPFNTWLTTLKSSLSTAGDHSDHSAFWDRVRAANISLIKHSEHSESKVTEEEADEFIRKEQESATPAVVETAEEDEEDDLLGMMD
ncbi:X-ray repair cross-complementing protein 5 [Thoreauomyces humboldtii]|nr:X-ray repair cross-complementing protein 5 [Thoreauomyces humboldtii]